MFQIDSRILITVCVFFSYSWDSTQLLQDLQISALADIQQDEFLDLLAKYSYSFKLFGQIRLFGPPPLVTKIL